jgi:hypothetical protein
MATTADGMSSIVGQETRTVLRDPVRESEGQLCSLNQHDHVEQCVIY